MAGVTDATTFDQTDNNWKAIMDVRTCPGIITDYRAEFFSWSKTKDIFI